MRDDRFRSRESFRQCPLERVVPKIGREPAKRLLHRGSAAKDLLSNRYRWRLTIQQILIDRFDELLQASDYAGKRAIESSDADYVRLPSFCPAVSLFHHRSKAA